MCWVSTGCRYPSLKVANKDITVYKIAKKINKKEVTSLFFNFKYKLNQVYQLNHEIIIEEKDNELFNRINFYINEGFHSWKEKPLCGYDSDIKKIACRSPMGEIFYSDDDYVILKCTIPLGAAYYENEVDDIVSEAIIINEMIPMKPTFKKVK